jgi:hypothetical protein
MVLRSVLVVRGGQKFWPDEVRYEGARSEVRLFLDGDILAAAKVAFGSADHLFFRVCAIVPALFEHLFHSGPWLPGLFFAATSTAVLWATGRLAREAGGGEVEQFFTVFAAATSAALFYYSRHFLSYDLSLFFFLLALALSMRLERSFWRSTRVGLWAAFGFLAYNGYWTLVPVTAGLYFATASNLRAFWVSAAGFIMGFLAPNIVTFVAARSLGVDLGASYASFSKTVVLGDYDEAWRFVGEYFWQTEGFNVAVFFAAICAILWAVFVRKSATGGIYALLIAIVVYSLIVVGADICHVFTVAARHVRAIAPFGAWAIGAALAWLFGQTRWGRIPVFACCCVMAFVAAGNFSKPLGQMFPLDFDAAAGDAILSDRAAGDGLQPLRIVNDTFLHNPDWNVPTPEGARILWSRPHPFNFIPYLFEGYGEKERTAYLQRERSMKVLRFDGVRPIGSFPYAFKLAFSPGLQSPQNLAEPILCSGSTGAGDLIFLQYLDSGAATIGYDHWGSAARVSMPFAFARGHEHSIIVIAPCLIGDGTTGEHGKQVGERWRHRVFVSVDGIVVMNAAAEFYATDEYKITVGLNLIGASTSQTSLELNAARFSAIDKNDWARADASQ